MFDSMVQLISGRMLLYQSTFISSQSVRLKFNKSSNTSVRVLCSAEAPLKKLFLAAVTNPVLFEDENRALMDDLNITKGSENAEASLFSGEEEVFAFDRTVSRLTEMQTEEYWKLRSNS
ncbi:AFG1-like ATPase [Trichonephila clavipes]|nr:AFG1-like ATPase [Trichonephila clavipes]